MAYDSDIRLARTIITADAFEWGTKVANRYTANFSSATVLDNAVFGDLLDVGWSGTAASAPGVTTSAQAGDLDSATDPGTTNLSTNANTQYFSSPPIIGGKGLLDAISAVTGTRPNIITCWFNCRFVATTDGADTTGIGIGNDADAVLAGAGRGYFLTVGATNFEIWNGAAAADTGVAVDTSSHLMKIEIDVSGNTYRVLLDGTQVVAATALAADIWPLMMQMYQGASGGAVSVFAWGVNYD